MLFRSRAQSATWGNEGCVSSIVAGSLPNGYISMTTGKVRQFHLQDIPSLTMPTVKILVVNDPVTPYRETDNLNTITTFSDGTLWKDYGKVVVWLIANKTGEHDFLCVNLPSKGEKDSAKAILDEKSRADYSVPIQYKSVGILLGAFALDITAPGTVVYDGVEQVIRIYVVKYLAI